MRFTLSELHMPPSSNHQYAAMAIRGRDNKWFGKIRPTRELEDYKKLFLEWKTKNVVAFEKCRAFVRNEILMKGKMVGIDTYSCFPGTSLWTQKLEPKKLDATNRIKALHDCISDALGVDDSCFWSGRFEKLESGKAHPWSFLEIYPHKPMSVIEWREQRQLNESAVFVLKEMASVLRDSKDRSSAATKCLDHIDNFFKRFGEKPDTQFPEPKL